MKQIEYNYSPTKDKPVEIRLSDIHGLGVFAKEDIPKDFIIAETHILIDSDLIRTPIGGFINCSNTPNAEIFKYPKIKRANYYGVKTITKILEGDEITIDYHKGMSVILEEDVELKNLKC